MIEAKEVKHVMRISESAICPQERRVTRHSLVQQIHCLQEFCSRGTAKTRQKKVSGARIKIESGDIACRGAFDFALFIWREFCMKLTGNRHCDLALNCEHVRKIPVIALSPQLPVVARIDQVRVEAHAVAGTPHTSFQYIRNPEFVADLGEIALDTALVLHRRGAADHL